MASNELRWSAFRLVRSEGYGVGDVLRTKSPNRLLKKCPSVVLASLRGSTYGREYDSASSLAADALGIRRVSARLGWAGETSDHFKHPEGRSIANTIPKITVGFERNPSFSAACWKAES